MALRAEPGAGEDPGDPVAVFLAGEVARGSWPGAVWIVDECGRAVSAGAVGSRAILPERAPAEADTIYDLASLTKPLATAALLAQLQDEGRLDLDDPAERFLPGLAAAAAAGGGRPTLRDLALQRSGLPAWRPFYLKARTPQEIVRLAVDLPLEAPCGARVLYSDPGYILLGEVLRVASGGRSIAELFAERIAGPLALGTMRFTPPTHLANRIAPTELGNRHERTLASRLVPDHDASRFRDRLIAGEVHDGNAHALGGVAGHAGLFGTAGEVVRLATEFFPTGGQRSRLFSPRALALFRENGTAGLEEARSLGWKLARAGCREAEGVLSPGSFGHTGFTGTSLFIDPASARIYVLLTNRVHPEVRPIDMNGLRRRFHEIASALP